MNANINATKIMRIALLAALSLIFLIALITGANILFFWSIFDWFCGTITNTTGIDNQLAKGLAALIMAALMMFPMGKLGMAFMPIPQKNKKVYRSLVFIGIAIFFLFLYFGGQNTYFDRQTGKALKYYSISPSGTYKFFSLPGYDPVTGDTLKAVTKEVILESKGFGKKIEAQPYTNPNPKYNYVPPTISPPTQKTEIQDSPPSPVTYQKPEPEKPDYSVPKQTQPKTEATVSSPDSYIDESEPINTPLISDQQTNAVQGGGSTGIRSKQYTPNNTEEYYGMLSFNNQSNDIIWVENSSHNRVATLLPMYKIVIYLPVGNYRFTNNNGSSYIMFTIPKGETRYLDNLSVSERPKSIDSYPAPSSRVGIRKYRPSYYDRTKYSPSYNSQRR